MTTPTLVAAAHGTKDLAGQATLTELIDLVRAQRPDVPVELCFVDVIEPSLTVTLAALTGPAVVVPVLLSTGFHVKTDIPTAIGDRPATVQAPPLGPDEKISRAAMLRLLEARPDGTGDDSVILIGAGSSDPEARRELEIVSSHLARWNNGPVAIGQLTDDDPFALAPDAPQVANYLLAPGFFNDKLHRLAASSAVVADPVGAHPMVAEVILERYDWGVSQLSS
jgi:sirohydrochlorin ferrochelatase